VTTETHVPVTGTNGKGNKWVRDSSQNGNNERKDPGSSANAVAQTDAAASTTISSVGDVIKADDKPNASFERKGTHSLVMKRETDSSNNLSNEAAAQTELEQSSRGDINHNESSKLVLKREDRVKTDGSTTRIKVVSSGNNTWKRQSSEIFKDPNADNNTMKMDANTSDKAAAQPEREHSTSSVMEHSTSENGDGKQDEGSAKSSSKLAFPGNKSRSWKHQSSELHEKSKGGIIMNDSTEKPTERAEGSSARSKVAFSGGKNSWKRQTSETPTPTQISGQGESYSDSQRKRKHAHGSTGPRRIRIMKPSISNDENSQEISREKQINAPDGQHENISDKSEASPPPAPQPPSSQKTLTDFCYQDTGRGRGRGRGRGHSSVRGGRATAGRSMGLVRVKPNNPSSTPICQIFRRGLPCNNPKCTLRHDVSTEASRPICVFFQRNGMCSKGNECPFRHVKVRWDAEICPMFEKVGYCEDPECLLRHVVAKKKT